MKAAVITAFDAPPRYGEVPEPVAHDSGHMVVDVLAVGLHHLTRAKASGRHYSSADALPLIAGADGVGRGPDGKLRYFVQGPGEMGTLAERTVIDLDHSLELPPEGDPVAMAAGMNPAMASWLALRCRVGFRDGMRVLVLGATGSSGSMAVQIAHRLGASQVIAVGRDAKRLAELKVLDATDAVALDDPQLGTRAAEVDVVLDFLWGEQAPRIMETLLRQRSDRARPVTWVHLGSMTGESAAIPGALLRSANLQIVGSGLGSVSTRQILEELPALAQDIARGALRVEARAVPLRDIESVWNDRTRERLVLIPAE
ncbi:MAG: zinc-binding alcohol dehydrogenase family protein [Sphingomonas sp.]|uniref:quinone oxidoreductase family protein n=1 Tax=Sphingomonas sp. TaxID=28214 RepID=UPI001B1DEB30|nr:zinc-binding alcohol dehydrogenase family protein [Sphingomonas sp.]MBO9624561.1 zinc-binding alcohol dehydrogenase family protein [Sphingomonas sp.]